MGVLALTKLLRRIFPLPAGYAEEGKSLKELSAEYRNWWWLFLLLFFLVFLPPLAGAWWWVLNRVAIFIASCFPDAVFQLRMSTFTLLLPALPLGMLTCGVPLSFVSRWCLKERYLEYTRFESLRQGYNSKAAEIFMCLFFSGLLLLILLPLFHWRAVFTKNEVVIYPFFGISPVRHTYKEIVDIRTAPQCRAPSGNVVVNGDKDHIIEFSDGYKWSTYIIWGETDDNEKQRLIDFVSAKSGKPVRQLPILEGKHW